MLSNVFEFIRGKFRKINVFTGGKHESEGMASLINIPSQINVID